MNHEIKAEWLRRLRDPNRKQLRGDLTRIHKDGSRSDCCLGVLCEIAVEQGVLVTTPTTSAGLLGYQYQDVSGVAFTMPPERVNDWADMDAFVVDYPFAYPDSHNIEGVLHLAELNDKYGLTFDQIADVIEYFG